MAYTYLSLTRPAPGKGTEEHPCEDHSFSDCRDDIQLIAVADGHGAAECDRAYKGSEFACRSAKDKLYEFAFSLKSEGLEPELLRKPEKYVRRLVNAIVTEWISLCKEDLPKNGCTETFDPIRYGTTLICAVKTDTYLLILQQGDGRSYVLHSDARTDAPVPWDDYCVGRATTSMCDEDAAERFRFALIDLKTDPVLAVYLETDGVEDCFSGPEQNTAWLNAIMSDAGPKMGTGFRPFLAECLDRMTARGSHDDISLAALIDMDRIPKYGQRFVNDHNLSQRECRLDSVRSSSALLKERIDKRVRKDSEAFLQLYDKVVRASRVPKDPGRLKEQLQFLKTRFTDSFALIEELLSCEEQLPADSPLPLPTETPDRESEREPEMDPPPVPGKSRKKGPPHRRRPRHRKHCRRK